MQLRLTFPDETAVPEGLAARTVADAVSREFTPFLDYPVNIAVPLGSGAPRAGLAPGALASSLALAPGVAVASALQRATPRTGFVQLVLRDPPLSSRSEALVELLRGTHAGLLVGGQTAEFVDLKQSIEAHAPAALAVAALATILVLLLMTGSLVLPVKALVFHVLAVAAAFGLLVLIFQKHLPVVGSLLAYRGPPAIETTISVVIIASTFGLATDYSILLLSRITEEHRAGRSDEEAVAIGVERTGPVITSSALLLAVALLALASSRVFLVKQLTVGQVLGVLIDVSFVRLLMVPSFMRLLGRYNWWAPPLLRRRGGEPSGRVEGIGSV
jgi:RND superfamily putative drug exporter